MSDVKQKNKNQQLHSIINLFYLITKCYFTDSPYFYFVNLSKLGEVPPEYPCPAGTSDNSPAVHCRDRRPWSVAQSRRDGRNTGKVPSLRDSGIRHHSDPAMNCRAVICRPCGTWRWVRSDDSDNMTK